MTMNENILVDDIDVPLKQSPDEQGGNDTAIDPVQNETLLSIATLVSLAKEVEGGNPINWYNMEEERDIVYSFMATRLNKFFQSDDYQNLTNEERIAVLQAATLNLSIQNFLHEKHAIETADDLK